MNTRLIIPSYNRADALRLTLAALTRETCADFEVLVVDDGSTDDSADVARSFESALPLRLLRQANRGAGAARNLGARIATAEFLIFLDADMIPAPGLVTAYIAAFAAQPGAIQIGRILAWPEAYQTRFDRVTKIEAQHDLGSTAQKLAFYHLASGNFAVGAETFRRLGGFDEALRMTEDTDLGYRAVENGIPLRYCPDAVGYHNHAKTLDQRCAYVEQSAFWTARLLAKHPGMTPLLPIYQDILSPRPGREPARLTARKLGRQALARPTIRAGLRETITLLEHQDANLRLLRSLYWKLLSGHRAAGFQRGWREVIRVDQEAAAWLRPA